MSDEHDQHDEVTGLDRRTLLKRGAVVGGAAVWATPVVQSLARPAFAAGSPVCTETYRFKYEVDGATFDNGDPQGGGAADCLPDGYSDAEPLPQSGQVPGKTTGVQIVLSRDGQSADIVLPRGCVLLDGDAKAGAKGNLECQDVSFDEKRDVYTVRLPTKEISFVAGVICC